MGYVFSLDLIYRKESIDRATQERITDREGYFVLACSKVMLLGNMLRTYRLKSRTEDVFRDFKHGIDIRPFGCSDENSLRGRVLIVYLALSTMYLLKYLSLQSSIMTA